MVGPAEKKLIVLNGPSSSGKTSLARALQEICAEPLLHIGLDAMISMLPFKFTAEEQQSELGYCLTPSEKDGLPLVRYTIGPYGKRLNRELVLLSQRLLEAGFDVIMDHIITSDETMSELISLVDCRRTYMIGITCDLPTLALRENEREDRILGLARGQSELVHAGIRHYDISIDTTEPTSDALAHHLLQELNATEPSACSRMAKRFSEK